MGESRSELIAWLNELLQPSPSITKIESLGSGASFCAVLDSIYGDVPLHRVKFQANSEVSAVARLARLIQGLNNTISALVYGVLGILYRRVKYQYVANFKVLQDTFKAHKIDKMIPVERLVKCKMQDNLEFCQWIKRFWDANTPGIEYDAVGRRGGQASGARGQTPTASSSAAARTTASRTAVRTSAASSNDRPPSTSTSATRRPLAGSAGAVPAGRIGYAAARPSAGSANQEAINALTEQMSEMRVSVEALEKERDFYFGKLRDIEVIIAERLEDGSSESTADTDILKRIQGILYQTEEGFEVPDLDGEVAENGLLDEEETF